MSAPRAARVAAQAKLNLFLLVGDRQPDGFHKLHTIFQLVDLADDIIVRIGGTGRTLHVAGPRLPDAGLGPTDRNLAYRAAVAYCEKASWSNGFSIELNKNVPVGAGLGGGSSDAGAVLRALESLNETPLGPAALTALAAGLGSDVPFFVSGSATAFGAGRGDEITGIDPFPPREVLLAIPTFGIGTADAYRWLDEDRARGARDPMRERIAEMAGPLMLPVWRGELDWNVVQRGGFNDFQPVVVRRHPEVREIAVRLADGGASIARMTGSGSVVFGIFDHLPGIPDGMPKGTTIIRTRTSTRVVPVEVLE